LLLLSESPGQSAQNNQCNGKYAAAGNWSDSAQQKQYREYETNRKKKKTCRCSLHEVLPIPEQ